jgi:hypothetical protein
MTREERDEWKKNNKAQGKKPKIEQLTQAVKDLVSGKKSFKDYYRMAKELMPSKLMDKVPTAATFKEIIGAIDSNKLKIGVVGLNKFVKKGMRVGLRIDIPSFNNHGKNVVTVHDRSKSGQEVIGYGSTGSIKNVNFRTSVPTAAKIGTGETSKSAFAMAEGEWMDESPESIQKRAEEAMNSPEWVQVSMNPARNSFFFDKADGNPVVSADEVLQVGNLVLAKNPKKIDLNTAEGMAEFERMFSTTDKKTGVTYQYRTAQKTTPGEVKTGRKFTGRAAVNRVVDFLKKANIDVEVVSDQRFKEVQKGTTLTGDLDGLFFTDEKSGKIYLRESKVDTHFGDILAFHEGIHPVMNIVAKTNPKLYDAIHDGLQNLAKENSETGRAIRKVIETQKRLAEENGWDPSTLKDEIIVEALATIAAKGLSIPQSQRGLKNAIIDFLNKIAKILNIPTKSRNVTDADFRAFAKKLSNAIREGGDIGDVINKRDIAAEAFSNTVTQDISAKGSTRSAVEKNPVYFENIKVFASQSSFDNKIQFKKAVQDLFNSYIPELKKKYGKAFNPSKNNALTKQYLSDIITDEAVRAINEHPEAIGWYDEKTRAALDVISAIHPEIATDKEARGSFILPLAVMSNGNLVDFNFDLAEKQYDYFKKNGRFNPVGGFGLQQSGIKKSLLLINSLLDNGLTMSDINTFLTSKYRAGDLKVNVDGKTKSLASGELADEMVYGAVILGPKIGNGFYMNLWGQFDQLTMDRWFMRTWGRLTGTLLKIDNNAITDGKKRISNALYAIKSDPEALKILKSIVPKLSGVSTADLAKIIEKASMKKDKRAILASNPKTDELRKAGNSLSKSMSGEKEAPANGNERKFIRDVFTDVARRLKEENNIDITMADLQAVLWYPEKILYESFKEGETFEEASEGYTSESAPDYFNAAKKLAIKLGVNETEINQALSRGRERTKRSVGETDSTAGNTVSEANKEALKKVADTIGKFKQEESKTKTSSKPSVSQERDMEPSLVDEAGLTKNMTEDGNGNYVFYHKTNKPLKTIDPKFFGKTLATSRDERPGVDISMYYTRPDAGESMVGGGYSYIVRIPKDKVYPINEDPLNLYDEAKRMFEKDYPGQAFDANKQVGYITKLAGQKGFQMTVTKWQKGALTLRAQTTTALKPEVHYSPIPGYMNAVNINEEIDAIEPNEVKMRREKRRAKASVSQEREMESASEQKSNFKPNKVFAGINTEISDAASEYKEQNGLSDQTPNFVISVSEQDGKKIADAYEKMQHDPNNPEVNQGFTELISEIKKQAEVLLSMGYGFQLSKEGEGYGSDSKKMADDVKRNKRIFVDPSSKAYGTKRTFDKDNMGLQDSGYKDVNGVPMTNVELIRAVHDLFGHAEFGNGFGAIGEENAWRNHMSMFTPLAQRALTTTTRGQNSWVNFGPNMRNEDGSIKKKGDEGYLSPAERPFAEQKIGFLPDWAMENAYGDRVVVGGKTVVPTNKFISEGKEIYEINDTEAFYNAIASAKESRGLDGIQVTLKTKEEYQDVLDKGGRFLITKDGLSGMMIEADGNAGSGFVHNDVPKGQNTLKPMLLTAIKLGARYTDAYDTFLPRYYSKFGFKVLNRIPFNEEYAEEGWKETILSTKPDVVTMYWDGGSREKIDQNYDTFPPYDSSQGKVVDDYDLAIQETKDKSNEIEESASLVPPKIDQTTPKGTAKASAAQDRGMDPELAYNEVDRLIEDGENSGMNGQQMYDSISKTEAYASLSPEDRSLVNDTLRSMGAVTSDPAASSIMSYDAGEKAAVLDALRDNKDLAYIYRNFREILTDLKEKGIIETDCI